MVDGRAIEERAAHEPPTPAALCSLPPYNEFARLVRGRKRLTPAARLYGPLCGAKLREFIDWQIAEWEAEDARKSGPPTEEERDNRRLWEAMTEETEWDRFYGEPVEE
jgi:hypothetical protein